jgi:hypothetical protein
MMFLREEYYYIAKKRMEKNIAKRKFKYYSSDHSKFFKQDTLDTRITLIQGS